MGEDKGGMIWVNSIETCILSSVKQITSPGWMHETSARGWCTGMTQRDGMGGRWEEGSGWGTHVNPWLIHINVWQKPLQYCKVISLKLIKIIGEKKSLISIPKKGSTKEQTIALISHACKVMLKILHARLQNFQMSSFQMNLVQLPDEPGTSRCPSWD